MGDTGRFVEALRRQTAFARLTDDDAARLAALAREARVDAGTTLFRQGDAPTAFYVLLGGAVRLTQRIGDEDPVLIESRLEAGACFGELDVLEDSRRSATALAETGVHLLAVARADFEDLMATSPTLAAAVLDAVAGER